MTDDLTLNQPTDAEAEEAPQDPVETPDEKGVHTTDAPETFPREYVEKLRQEALKQIQQVMTDETGKPMVDDLLFNNLIVQ